MANIDFYPRQRGDREQMKFGATGSSVDSTVVFVKIGGQAKNIDGTTAGEVSEDQAVAFKTDLTGRLLTSNMHPRFFNYSSYYFGAQGGALIQNPPGANTSIYITDIMFGTSTNCSFRLGYGSSGEAFTDVVSSINVSLNKSPMIIVFGTPIKVTANSTLYLTSNNTMDASAVINGYIAS